MTAMDTLAAIGADAPEIPRFDDGMVNINELVRTLAEAIVNEIMDAQAEDACAEGNQRNGYRERQLLTSVGRITLRIPKLRRGTYFPEDLIERYSRVDRAVVAAVAEMVTSGASTRKAEKVARAPGVDRMSASQVSRICESLDAAVADALAYLDFPPAHHRRLRTNNVQERVNREIKRRANVVQVFPSRKSLIRLLGAVLSEMDEDWAARRWFTEESISEVFEDRRRWRPGRPPAYEGTAAEHAARIIAVVMADGGAVRKAA